MTGSSDGQLFSDSHASCIGPIYDEYEQSSAVIWVSIYLRRIRGRHSISLDGAVLVCILCTDAVLDFPLPEMSFVRMDEPHSVAS